MLCYGYQLPDVRRVTCRQPVGSLADCCMFVEAGEEILLFESQAGKPYYWVILDADETPLQVCHLEVYADHSDWVGRRSDYLALGWYGGECYMLVIELRDQIVREEQALDKLAQVEHSIAQVMARLEREVVKSQTFRRACDRPDRYKVAGMIIAPAGIRGVSRDKWLKRVVQPDYSAVIALMPRERIRDCQVKWSELMATLTPYGRQR